MVESKIIPMRFIDRSRTVQDWRCPRSRYWNYEHMGTGLSPKTTSIEFFMGITIHDALAAVAQFHQDSGEVPIDDIASTAHKQMYENLLLGIEGTPSADDIEYATEQAVLVEGLIRGFHLHVWPRLMALYPKIVAIETEMNYTLADGFIFMTKPDLIVEDQDGELIYLEYKSTSSKKDNWIKSWETAVQLHSSIKATEATLGRPVGGVQIVGLYKGYESYGKQSSPFCLAPDTPVLKSDLSWSNIANIKVGDELVAFDEEPVKTVSTKPHRRWRNSIVSKIGTINRPSVRVTFSDGTYVDCSEDHMWLTAHEGTGLGAPTTAWRPASKLRPSITFGKRASRVVKLITPWEQDDSYEAGYLGGLLDGEGWLSNISHVDDNKTPSHITLGFSQKPGDILESVMEQLTKNGIKYYGPYGLYGNHSSTSLQINNKVDVMRTLGYGRPKRLLKKFNPDNLGIAQPLGEPVVVVDVSSIGLKEVFMIETSTKTLIANGYASHNCYAYKKSGNPPFTQDQIEYSYKAGFRRYATWELPGGIKSWVESMPENILATQFPMTPRIFVNEDLVKAFFEQRLVREDEIAGAMKLLSVGPDDTLMDRVFPQRFDQCVPSFGWACPYTKLCHGYVADPLAEDFVVREPHHAQEKEQYEMSRE